MVPVVVGRNRTALWTRKACRPEATITRHMRDISAPVIAIALIWQQYSLAGGICAEFVGLKLYQQLPSP